MGWCHEFGPDISDTCDHPMTAGADRCFCEVCGVECKGRFSGCVEVWAQGPKDVTLVDSRSHASVGSHGGGQSGQQDHRGESETIDVVEAERFEALVTARPSPREPAATSSAPATRGMLDRAENDMVGVRVWSEPDEERLIADLVDKVTSRVAETVEKALERHRTEVVPAQGFSPEHAAVLGEQMNGVVAGIQAQCEAMLHGLQAATQQLSRSVAGVQEFATSLREQLQMDWVSDELGESVKEVREVSSELREELARLAAFRRALADGYPAVARAVEYASVKAATRFAELTRAVDDLAPAAPVIEQANGHALSTGPVGSEGDDLPSQWS